MKNYFFLITFTVVLFSCQNKTQEKVDQQIIPVEADAIVAISIDGMVCQHGCANYLSEQISEMEGVKDCQVSFENSLATISYDNSLISEVSIVDLINSSKDSIYSVTNVDVELIKKIKKEKIQTH
jgi:Cu+-exporting ATPase